jgi:hypothetical protein
MVAKIYRLESDLQNMEQMAEWLRNRKLNQKFLYTDSGAEKFYGKWAFLKNKETQSILTKNKLDFWIDIFSKAKNIPLISLWSWSWETEKKIIEESKQNIDAFLVDSSEEMLNIADKHYKDSKINYTLIKSDIWNIHFPREIKSMTKKYSKRVYTFLGNTFWNIEHTNIIEILYNLLKKWDQVWIDIIMMSDDWLKENVRLFQQIENHTNSHALSFCTSKLKDLWIYKDWEKLNIKMKHDTYTKSLKFIIWYELKENQTINLRWKITLLKGEILDLIFVNIYSEEWITKFFWDHGFKMIKSSIKHSKDQIAGQFLFEKK